MTGPWMRHAGLRPAQEATLGELSDPMGIRQPLEAHQRAAAAWTLADQYAAAGHESDALRVVLEVLGLDAGEALRVGRHTPEYGIRPKATKTRKRRAK